MQKITSANTSLHQIPALHKSAPVIEQLNTIHPAVRVAVDIGCGKYPDEISKFMRENYECGYFPYDPYNMPDATNALTMKFIHGHGFRIALCANVLNVIDDNDAMEETIKLCATAVRRQKGKAFFSVYEGDRSGVQKETRAGYQRNTPTAAYIPFIQKHFQHIERRGKVICAWN